MARIINPETIAKPASNYAQGIVHNSSGERLVISGQIGVRPDGTIEAGMEAQMDRAWTNLMAVVAAAGFQRTDIIKVTIFVTEAGRTALHRQLRDKHMAGHTVAATYLQVAGLASPDFLVEIEAEAVRAPA
jgi:2-iminobutanoate/2-iminopropanoate deaminase